MFSTTFVAPVTAESWSRSMDSCDVTLNSSIPYSNTLRLSLVSWMRRVYAVSLASSASISFSIVPVSASRNMPLE